MKPQTDPLLGDLGPLATSAGLNPREALHLIETARDAGMDAKAALEAGRAALADSSTRCSTCGNNLDAAAAHQPAAPNEK